MTEVQVKDNAPVREGQVLLALCYRIAAPGQAQAALRQGQASVEAVIAAMHQLQRETALIQKHWNWLANYTAR